MELRQLRSFAVAARLHSISRAAEELNVGQPTVTTHIKKLEDELGVTLFDRVKRPIQLTLAGSALAELATPLVEGIDSLAVDASRKAEQGPVTIASTADIIPHVLLEGVKVFKSTFPRVMVRIRSRRRDEVIQLVEAGEVDMGLVPGPERNPALEFQSVFGYERVLIAPKGHPVAKNPLVSLDQIAEWPLVLMGPRTHTRTVLEEEFRRKGLSWEVVVELDSMDVIKKYVAEGMGISVGPRLSLEPGDEDHLEVLSLAALMPMEQAGIVTLQGKSMSVPAQNFIALFKETMARGSTSA